MIKYFFLIFWTSPLLVSAQTFSDRTYHFGIDTTLEAYFIADLNNDGYEDYVGRRGNDPITGLQAIFRLLKNNGNSTFQDITSSITISDSVTMFPEALKFYDLDNDGWKDVILGARIDNGACVILWGSPSGFSSNNRTEFGKQLRDQANSANRSIVVDVNHDGRLDMIFERFGPDTTAFQRLFINTGNRDFVPASLSMFPSLRPSVSSAFRAIGDINRDGRIDFILYQGTSERYIYLSRDQPTYQVIETFTEPFYFISQSPRFIDFNSDGLVDAYPFLSFGGQAYYTCFIQARGIMNYNIADTSLVRLSVSDIGTPIQTRFQPRDFNNDGYIDFFGGTGYDVKFPLGPMRLYLGRRAGSGMFYQNIFPDSLINPRFNITLTPTMDIDNDGDIDILGRALGEDASLSKTALWQNNLGVNSGTRNWLKIKLQGTQTNRDAIGTNVALTNWDSTGGRWYKQIRVCEGNVIHYGLGDSQSVDSVLVIWGSGRRDLLRNVAANRTVTIVEGSSPLSSTVQKENSKPVSFKLEQNYPNPFNPSTIISYQLPKSSNVKITVFDMLGREIQTLLNERKSAGSYNTTFTANNLASGVYIYRIQADEFTMSKKMLLIK
jgi:Secretion system C-terminal sorting domain/FG-GAP-like repeat/ASPIC and UnbV